MKLLKALGFGGTAWVVLRAFSLVGMVFAAAFLYYDWSVTMTGATPQVRFIDWDTGTLYNTIDLTYNIYADLWLVDDNATYGIKNTGTTAKTVYLWVDSCNATNWFSNFTIQILNETGTVLATWTTTDFSNIGEANAISWTADANGIKTDTIKVMFKGSSDVVVGNVVRVTLKLKTAE